MCTETKEFVLKYELYFLAKSIEIPIYSMGYMFGTYFALIHGKDKALGLAINKSAYPTVAVANAGGGGSQMKHDEYHSDFLIRHFSKVEAAFFEQSMSTSLSSIRSVLEKVA